MKKMFLVLVVPILFNACSDDKPSPKSDKAASTVISTSRPGFLTVVDQAGAPIAGAKILIGQSVDTPFAGNFLTAGTDGSVAIPAGWTTAQAVTVQADGFVRLTELAQLPQGLLFTLRSRNSTKVFQLSGTTLNHHVEDGDGLIDFGIVMSAFSRRDILAFDIQKILSSDNDQISVVGQDVKIPSNVTLPDQSESYLFFPIEINKPTYRFKVEGGVNQPIFALGGRFKLSTVVDGIRDGNKFYDLINDFTFSGGVLRNPTITSDLQLNLPIDEISFDGTETLHAPAFADSQIMLALAVTDSNGWLLPSDVKNVESGQDLDMTVASGQKAYSVSVLKNASDFAIESNKENLSAVILPFAGGASPKFLPLINGPQLSASRLLLSKPAAIANVSQLATYALYSDVGSGVNRLWEVYSANWIDHVDLPTWPNATPLPVHQRWEVTYIGSQTTATAPLGQGVIDAATHVTHSSTDF